MNLPTNYDGLFSGVIGQDYEMPKLICPLMTKMPLGTGLKET